MEKLMKLLNEYQKGLNGKEGNKRNYEMYERELNDDNIRMNDLDDPYEGLNMYGGYAKARLISKQFGFIKRIVENEKINLKDLQCLGNDEMQEDFSAEELLLMILSIQDEPVKFLSDILK